MGVDIAVGSAVLVKFKPGFNLAIPLLGYVNDGVNAAESVLKIAANLLLTITLPTVCDADKVSVTVFPWKSVAAAPTGVCGPINVQALPVYPRN